MRYLLDTNIISELARSEPHKNVKKWFQEIPSEALYISVLTIGEIREGIEKLHDSKRKYHLLAWLEYDLPKWFSGNILSIDLEVAERWGFITSILKSSPGAIDTLLAATALTHNLKIVTQNIKDFNIPGLEVINPFEY